MVSYMYLIIILECVKSSLDINILKKKYIYIYIYVSFVIKMSWPLMWLNWSVATINATLQLLEINKFMIICFQ